jgi:orotate phosphoribosyltransferase-like protein
MKPWHMQARALRQQGWKREAIAAQFNRSVEGVRYALGEKPQYSRWKPEEQDVKIERLWKLGYDTLRIARNLKVKEHHVYNRLIRIRERGR